MRSLMLLCALFSCFYVTGCSKDDSGGKDQAAAPAVKEQTEPASQAVQQATEKVGKMAAQAKEKVAAATETAKEKVSAGMDQVEAKAGEMKTEAQALLTGVQDKMSAAAGQAIYTQYCSSCHDSGVLGAPKTGDKAAWGALVKDVGVDKLVQNAINGIGNMPPRGGHSQLTDSEMKSAVEYMVEQSK